MHSCNMRTTRHNGWHLGKVSLSWKVLSVLTVGVCILVRGPCRSRGGGVLSGECLCPVGVFVQWRSLSMVGGPSPSRGLRAITIYIFKCCIKWYLYEVSFGCRKFPSAEVIKWMCYGVAIR